MRALCDGAGIAFLDVSSAFVDEDLDALRIAPNDAHPNARANGIFAAAVRDWLDQKGWVPQ